MNFIKSLKPDNLTKILFAVFLILAGVSVFLIIQISNNKPGLQINPVLAQDSSCIDSEYAKCCQAINVAAGRPANGSGAGIGGNCLQSDAASCQGEATAKCAPVVEDGEYPGGTNCRVREKRGCVSAEFKRETLSKLQDPYEMLYCESIADSKINGWYYGNAQAKGDINDKFGSCGSDSLCEVVGPGLHDSGEGTSCGNPYRCPEATPTPNPTPTPSTPPTPTGPSVTPTPTRPGQTPPPSTPTPTPTPNPAQCVNTYFDVNGQQLKTITASSYSQTVAVKMVVKNSNGTPGFLNIYNKENTNNNIPSPAIIPVRDANRDSNGIAISSGMVLTGQIRGFVTPTQVKNAQGDTVYSWTVNLDRLFGSATNRVIDTATGRPLNSVQLNGIAGGTVNAPNCVITINQPARTVQNPSVEIVKQRVSPNFQKVGDNIVFNISVRNTGDVDLRNFNLSDNFDPNYLRFESSIYTKNGRTYTINPTSTDSVNGRSRLNWINLPPKSNIVPNEDGVLTTGETMTLTVTFKILKNTTPALVEQNRNCGVVSTISYIDNQGQTQQVTLNPAPQSCDEFETKTETPFVGTIDKTVLTPNVILPNEVRFKAVIKNTDQEQRTYTDIDFTDEYEVAYLKPNKVIVTNPAGRSSTILNLTNTGILKINNLQNLTDNGGTALGPLLYNQSYSLEIIFNSVSPTVKTCDTVFADISNGTNGGTTNRDTECAKITPPPPPNTGADAILNLLIPGIGMVIAGVANFIVRRKVI